jgi:photosystem II stability/assembly factor-like uncharacterized protein
MKPPLLRIVGATCWVIIGFCGARAGLGQLGSVRLERIASLPTVPCELCSLQMIDAGTGWLFGRRALWATHDGGRTWSGLPSPGTRQEVARGRFDAHGEGWVLTASGGLSQTLDRGVHWSPSDPPKFDGAIQTAWAFPEIGLSWLGGGVYRPSSSPDAPNYAVKRYGSGVWGVKHPVVLSQTRDGEWIEHDLPACDWTIVDLRFWDERHGFAVGDRGCFYYTADGGADWALGSFSGRSVPDVPDQGSLPWCAFLDENNGWMSFDDDVGSLFRTVDAGRNWYVVAAVGAVHFTSLQFRDHMHGLGVGRQKDLYQSADAGITWSRVGTDALIRSAFCAGESCWVLSDESLYRVSWR